MEKTYRIQNLVLKFAPSIIKLFGYSYDWAREDRKFDDRVSSRNGYFQRNSASSLITKQSFIDLLLKAESADPSAIDFLRFVDALIDETVTLVPEFKNRIKENFIGKLTSTSDWNYLNPIGEIACLKRLTSTSNYRLKTIECAFPNGRSKDFLVENLNQRKSLMIEVLNIHPKSGTGVSDEKVIEDIIAKLRNKMITETAGVDPTTLTTPLIFMPVLWNVSIEWIEQNQSFFQSFNASAGKYLDLSYKSTGFSTLLKRGSSYQFGEVCSHFIRN